VDLVQEEDRPLAARAETLARIVAASTGAAFEEMSAVSATVKDVREVLARAKERLGTAGRRTILFLDEIHRFNKAQQDALLPGVESGLVTLIGATTENPYYEVNSALISRTQVYELEPLTEEELAEIVRRGAAELDVELADELVALVTRRAVEDRGVDAVLLDRAPQRRVLTQDVRLADELAERRRPQPLRERRDLARMLVGGVGEEVTHDLSMLRSVRRLDGAWPGAKAPAWPAP